MNSSLPNRTVLLALITIQLLFGLNYIFSKIIMEHIPPLIWGSIRCASTAFILASIAITLRKFDPKKAGQNWRPLLLFSLLGIVLNQGCFLLGLHRTTPTNSALLNTLIPIFTVLVVSLRGVEKFTPLKILGFATAFSGVLILQHVENLNFGSETFVGDLLTISNALFYSLFLGFSQDFFSKNDFTWSTTWLFIFGTPGFFTFAGYDLATFQWTSLPLLVVLAAIANVLLGTVSPYLLISFTLSKTSSSLVALFVYVQPLVASILAYFFFGHVVTGRTLLSGVLIFSGVFLVLLRKNRRQNQPILEETEQVFDNVIPIRSAGGKKR